MSQVEPDPDYVFYNATIVQNTASGGNEPTPAVLQVNRSAPLINQIEDFYVTIGRLSFPSNQLPLITAALTVGSAYAANQTIYAFTLTYNGFSSGKTYVTWIPTNTTSPRPSGTVQVCLQSKYQYYYCYTFARFCEMLNAALLTAFVNLGTASGGTLPMGATAPYFNWDPTKGSTVLFCQKANYESTNATPIKIYFNNELSPILNEYYFDRIANNDPNGLDNRMHIVSDNFNTFSGDNTLFAIYPSTFDSSYWPTISALQLVSSIPLNYELVEPINYNYGQQTTLPGSMTQTTSVNPSNNIITDFIPDFSAIQNFGALFIYNKVDQWRYSAIVGKGPLTTFTLSLQWTDSSGNTIPLYLSPNTTVSVKVGFFKKSLLNTNSTRLLQALKGL